MPEDEPEEKYTKRKINVSTVGEFTKKQEEIILDMATEYLKQIKAICDNADLNLSYEQV